MPIKNIIDATANVGKGYAFEEPVNILSNARVARDVTIGRYSYVGVGTTVGIGTTIGRFCSIARACQIGPVTHPTGFMSTHPFQYNMRHFRRTPGYKSIKRVAFDTEPGAVLGHDVWVGTKVVVMRGITIGHGAVLAAGAIVTKDVKPYQIVGGVPAKPLKMRFPGEIVERLLAAQWWNRPIEQLSGLPFDDIEACLDQLEAMPPPETADIP